MTKKNKGMNGHDRCTCLNYMDFFYPNVLFNCLLRNIDTHKHEYEKYLYLYVNMLSIEKRNRSTYFFIVHVLDVLCSIYVVIQYIPTFTNRHITYIHTVN